MNLTERTGAVAGIRHIHEEDDVLLVTAQGMLIRTQASGIRRTGRHAQGVRLINVNGEDRVVAVAKLAEREEGEDHEAVH